MLDTREGSFSVQHPEEKQRLGFCTTPARLNLHPLFPLIPCQDVIPKFCLWCCLGVRGLSGEPEPPAATAAHGFGALPRAEGEASVGGGGAGGRHRLW